MKALLLLLLVCIGCTLHSQTWEKSFNYYTNTSQANNHFDYHPLHGGIITADDNNFSSSNPHDIIAFDTSGNQKWRLTTLTDSFPCDAAEFDAAILDNGNYVIAGSGYGTWYYYGVTTILKPNGGVSQTKMFPMYWPFNNWYEYDVNVFARRNSGSTFFRTFTYDSSTTFSNYGKFSELNFELVDSTNTTVWSKKKLCIDTSAGFNEAVNRIYKSCVAKDNSLVSCYKAPCLINSTLVIEKLDAAGNTVFQTDLQPYLNGANDSLQVLDMFPCKDTSVIVSAYRYDNSAGNRRCYLFRVNKNGVVTDSTSTFTSSWIFTGFENSGGNLYLQFMNTSYTGSGMIKCDEHFNLLTTYVMPFTVNNYAIRKMIPNNYGGAYCGYSAYWASTKNIRILNFDSTLITYPAMVSGNVYLDVNKDCMNNSGDLPLGSELITIKDAANKLYYGYPDSSGYYMLRAPSGNYTLNYNPSGNLSLECASMNTFTLTNTSALTIDIADTLPANMNDLQINMHADPHIPGFISTTSIFYHNAGVVTQNTELKFVVDTALQFVSAFPSPSQVNGDTLTFTLPSFGINDYGIIDISLKTDSTIPLGQVYSLSASITNFTSDFNPSNNTAVINDSIIGAYDPNDKQVNQPYLIQGDEEFVYKIRFQNTGTFYAQTVTLIDTISSLLNQTTLQVLDASAPYQINLNSNGLMRITFSNINLPDKS